MKFRTVLVLSIIALMLVMPSSAADTSDEINSAGSLYSQSVDLANEGKYQQALNAADNALAMNVTSLTGLIQSNRAGILVMLDRNEEAVTAADAALAVEGNLTAVHSIAWYNKGNALRNLGRISEAKDAYDRAYALDNTLVPPDMSGDVPLSTSTPANIAASGVPSAAMASANTAPTARSPLTPLPAFAAIGVIAGFFTIVRKK